MCDPAWDSRFQDSILAHHTFLPKTNIFVHKCVIYECLTQLTQLCMDASNGKIYMEPEVLQNILEPPALFVIQLSTVSTHISNEQSLYDYTLFILKVLVLFFKILFYILFEEHQY